MGIRALIERYLDISEMIVSRDEFQVSNKQKSTQSDELFAVHCTCTMRTVINKSPSSPLAIINSFNPFSAALDTFNLQLT